MAKKPKLQAVPKEAKPAKTPKAAKPKTAKAAKAVKGHNSATLSQRDADAIREGFLVHRRAWVQLTAKQKALDKQWTDAKAALKADGYKIIQMQIADDLGGSPKQEAKVHAAVRDRLQVAQWVGHPMGAQLDMFSEPDRTPAEDRAYDEGKQASMENKPRKPPYDPSLPQHQKWLEGYGDHQKHLASGFKPLDDWGDSDPARPIN